MDIPKSPTTLTGLPGF